MTVLSAIATPPIHRATPAPSRPVDRLQGVSIDAESGLHIGTIRLGEQELRVGIRPLPAGTVGPARRC